MVVELSTYHASELASATASLVEDVFFLFIHNADSSSTDFATALSLCISGRSPNQQHSRNKDNVCAFCGTGEVDAR